MFLLQEGDRNVRIKRGSFIASWVTLLILVSGCSQSAESCFQQPLADLSGALAYAEDDQLAFQFPLAALPEDVNPLPAKFCSRGGRETFKHHAAEDYFLPAGSPVYAIADGRISFSGPMGGYGWLIIIDHPWANLYSLYGHLSPSRWTLASGVVEKGDLIGYLGDPDENGGSQKNPLRPHLHFGIRAGQRVDYAGFGEWRWMAGWIKPCPSEVGWLRPSWLITSQEIPPGGFPEPQAGLIEQWQGELILLGIYLSLGLGVGYNSWKSKKPLFLVLYGCAMGLGGWYFFSKGTRIQYALLALAGISLALAGYQFLQARKAAPD